MTNMTDEENAALVIKTGIEQLFVPLQKLLETLLGPAATEVGLSFGDSAKVWRFKRQIRLLQEVKRLLDQSGRDIKPIATRLFFPVLEAASIEDDDEMQTRWAALLANEATNIGSVHPSFIEMLKQLAPGDARLLDKLYDHCVKRHTQTVTPWVDQISVAERDRRLAAGESPEEEFDNLVRLGLVVSSYELLAERTEFILPDRKTRAVGSKPKLKEDYILSDLAVRFVKVCRAPKPS
jgi:Abortive infection alpha/Protein of unknown function (DUF2806)